MITRNLSEITKMIKGSFFTGDNVVIKGVSIDSRNLVEGSLFIPIIGTNSNGHQFIQEAIIKGAVATLWEKKEPNYPTNIPVIFVDDTTIALQQLAVSYRQQLKATFIGITGSNGKTSTKDILHSILSTGYKAQKTQENYNNEIGVPLTLLQLKEDVEMAVIEMGMGHKGDITFLGRIVQPNIGIITNIGNAHLSNLGSLKNIALEKMAIMMGIDLEGVLFYNGDSSLLVKEAERYPHKKYTFGVGEMNDIYLTSCRTSAASVVFTASQSSTQFHLPLIGEHQAVNSLVAISVAKYFNMSDKWIQQGLDNVILSSKRNEIIKIGNITIINDTYKSNPESVKAAIDTLAAFDGKSRKLFVMGDMLDMGSQDKMLHEQVGEYVKMANLDAIFGYGELTFHTIASVKKEFPPNQAIHFKEEAELIEGIIEYTKEPCTILFKASRNLQFEKLIELLEQGVTL
ncbi:UDP-N-acetylmuramoyl-tripeptide-D-alanyl-D-alanine ligase [Bacillus cereus HuB4-4]|uniref:UDP-N-acetylmuramoyl-tripeptide--D-alanyl-D-alanine ligase n=1 Tax=Bacillus cereus HuB4-4 TaxID=1053211 RepID=A0A9W5VMF6_BACCE|nr:UDP-N-acetylmuramoyl-tripeptide--D-alanyl-D-alanine ligase [Bacillus cereus]EOP90891.1 UDP-N-acetylmuramoyl-tripeptide-D-alanyl-D-alanine ligase [Bacillus cereus HuB4-4]